MKCLPVNAPVSWGVEEPFNEHNPPYNEVLSEISLAGYEYCELGPYGYLPTDSHVLAKVLDEIGLKVIAGTLMESFQDPDKSDEICNKAESLVNLLKSVNASYLIVISALDASRNLTAGRSSEAKRLDSNMKLQFFKTICTISELCEANDLNLVFHPHVGTYVEFLDEINWLVNDVSNRIPIEICVDTGHSFYAGINPANLVRELGPMVKYVHIKDVISETLENCKKKRMSFLDSVVEGVFCPIGKGSVDFKDFKAALDEIGYSGYATIEQDRQPNSGNPLEDARSSLEIGRNIGLF